MLIAYLLTFHWTKPLIFADSLYKDDENIPKISKDLFCDLLTVATKDLFLIFNNKFYKQIDGVAVSSFMRSFGKQRLAQRLPPKPVFYRRYIDDICTAFLSRSSRKV